MQRAFHLLSLAAALVALNGCSSHSVHTEGALGPYDSQGNYIEAWADDPSKWRYPAGGSAARIDVPRGDVTPLWGRGEPAVILPPSGGSAAKPATKAQAARSVTPPPVARPSTPPSRPRATAPKPVAKPKAKPQPKPKPKPAPPKTVTIQRGDSLSKLAARHGTTVTELKRANGLRGDLIIAGKSLKIPPKKR